VNVVVVITVDPNEAVQFDDILAAKQAVDGDTTTASCTSANQANNWWAIDLGQSYTIDTVTITAPNFPNDPRKYH